MKGTRRIPDSQASGAERRRSPPLHADRVNAARVGRRVDGLMEARRARIRCRPGRLEGRGQGGKRGCRFVADRVPAYLFYSRPIRRGNASPAAGGLPPWSAQECDCPPSGDDGGTPVVSSSGRGRPRSTSTNVGSVPLPQDSSGCTATSPSSCRGWHDRDRRAVGTGRSTISRFFNLTEPRAAPYPGTRRDIRDWSCRKSGRIGYVDRTPRSSLVAAENMCLATPRPNEEIGTSDHHPLDDLLEPLRRGWTHRSATPAQPCPRRAAADRDRPGPVRRPRILRRRGHSQIDAVKSWLCARSRRWRYHHSRGGSHRCHRHQRDRIWS